MPLLWDTLSIQHCPSYCPPATPITQSYREALGLPPIEDNDESTIISGEDGSFQEDMGKYYTCTTHHCISSRKLANILTDHI